MITTMIRPPTRLPADHSRVRAMPDIPQRYRNDIAAATELLKNEGGCSAVYLFGSLVTGKVHENSDIDIGVRGLEPKKFFRMYGKLQFDFDTKIDMVDFDTNNDFFALLNKYGEVVQIG